MAMNPDNLFDNLPTDLAEELFTPLLQAGDNEPVELRRGSYLNIPAHARHRVVWMDRNQQTIWLAIHYRG